VKKSKAPVAYARGSERKSHVQRVLPNRDREGVGDVADFFTGSHGRGSVVSRERKRPVVLSFRVAPRVSKGTKQTVRDLARPRFVRLGRRTLQHDQGFIVRNRTCSTKSFYTSEQRLANFDG
jgi:hypothetical protein